MNTAATSTLEFLAAMFAPDDIVEFRCIKPRTGARPDVAQKWCKASDVASLVEWCERLNQDGFNVYIGANPRKAIGATGDKNVLLARSFFVDFDGIDLAEAMRRIEAASLPIPSIIVLSGHGVHCYWLVDEPCIDQSVWTEFQKDLIAALGSDRTIHNAERIMRLPGFTNHKPPAAACELMQCDTSRVYESHDLLERIPTRRKDDEAIEAAAAAPKKSDAYRDSLNGEARVIDRYNERYSVKDVLRRNGYTDAGDRMMRPGAEPGSIPSVQFFTDKNGKEVCYTWSENDRLFDKHRHDAFSAYLILECGGDIRKAVAKAADLLGMKQKRNRDMAWDQPGNEPGPAPAIDGEEDVTTVTPSEIPDPIPLSDPEPPAFPANVFTGWAGDFVRGISDATETPIELAASAMFAVIAAAVQGKASVRVEPDYFEQLSFYVAAFLVSGQRKSGALNPMLRPLMEWEREKRAEIEPEIKRVQSERATIEQRIKKLRAKAAETGDAATMKEVTDLELTIPDVPIVPRAFTQDCTTEHLGTMLARNNERLAIFSDEGGMFDVLAGRYSNSIPNLDLVLQAYTGSPVRVDRGSRESVLLDHPALTICVTPQPSVAEGLATKPGFRGRGLLARFAYCIPASNLGNRRLEPRPIPEQVTRTYGEYVKQLLDIPVPTDHPTALTMDPQAYRPWKAFQREIEPMMRAGGTLEALTDVGGKLPGLAARIAGLLHMADYGASGIDSREIQPAVMDRAIHVTRFYLAHALAVFGLMGADASMTIARRLWREIQKLGALSFTAREAWNPTRGTYPKMEDVEPGFRVLVERGWLLESDEDDQRKRGRPSRRFTVNPKADGFAHSADMRGGKTNA